jgi:hypothetical protein
MNDDLDGVNLTSLSVDGLYEIAIRDHDTSSFIKRGSTVEEIGRRLNDGAFQMSPFIGKDSNTSFAYSCAQKTRNTGHFEEKY